jgi:hypothetical protein
MLLGSSGEFLGVIMNCFNLRVSPQTNNKYGRPTAYSAIVNKACQPGGSPSHVTVGKKASRAVQSHYNSGQR